MTDNEQPTAPFGKQLKQALEHFADAAWLGENSSLAEPYFLGARLREAETGSAAERGRALQQLLRDAAERMAAERDDGAYYRTLIDLHYFQGMAWQKVIDVLHISKNKFYRDRDKAVERLEDALIYLLNPSLRLERPPPGQGAGREDVIAAGRQALGQGQAVALLGPGGIGKTALGAHLAATLAAEDGEGRRPVFWFTLRPGLNDRASNLLFSLAYFLHRQGAAGSWRQLVADKGEIDSKVALKLVRHDLAALQARGILPLLCFDEMDLLQPAALQAHDRVLKVLEALRGLAPLLFMGQHLPVRSDVERVLAGLPLYAIEQMLQQASVFLSRDDLAGLERHTHGNPQLLQLFITLYRAGAEEESEQRRLQNLLQLMAGAPSLELLLERVGQRLGEGEQDMLTELSVFRHPAPVDAWPEQPAHLDRLVDLGLARADDQGGVALAPAFQAVLYNWLRPEHKETLHRHAAGIRTARGQYTAAAHHYVAGGQPQLAVKLWDRYKEQEINQGQAETALTIFGQLSTTQLNEKDGETLGLLRNQLRLLLGRYDEAEKDLSATPWRPGSPSQARARRLQGLIAEQRGELERALRHYEEGKRIIESLLERELALFHKNIGWSHMLQRQLAPAWRKASLARFEAVRLQGIIKDKMGDFEAANAYLQEALALAQKLDYREGEAKIHHSLALMFALQGQLEEVRRHGEWARQYYSRIGSLTRVAGFEVNLAMTYNQAEQPELAIPLAKKALDVFEDLGVPRGVSAAGQALAEAHLALSELEEAEYYAYVVIRQETPTGAADGLRILAEVRLAQGRLPEAEELCHESIKQARDNQDRFLEAYGLRVLGRVHLAQGLVEKASAALAEALALFEALQLPREQAKTQRILQSLDG